MKTPFRSLLHVCAYGLLLLALYLNFVDLNRVEIAEELVQPTLKNNLALAAGNTQHQIAARH